jgi:hypothetical protein
VIDEWDDDDDDEIRFVCPIVRQSLRFVFHDDV